MRLLLAFLAVSLLFDKPSFAWPLHVAQFYGGAAKPREEVAWIWLGGEGVQVTEVDHAPVPPACIFAPAVVELLPGKHEIWVRYWSSSYKSPKDIRLEVDAASSKDFIVKANAKVRIFGQRDWNPIFTDFSPKPKPNRKVERCH